MKAGRSVVLGDGPFCQVMLHGSGVLHLESTAMTMTARIRVARSGGPGR